MKKFRLGIESDDGYGGNTRVVAIDEDGNVAGNVVFSSLRLECTGSSQWRGTGKFRVVRMNIKNVQVEVEEAPAIPPDAVGWA